MRWLAGAMAGAIAGAMDRAMTGAMAGAMDRAMAGAMAGQLLVQWLVQWLAQWLVHWLARQQLAASGTQYNDLWPLSEGCQSQKVTELVLSGNRLLLATVTANKQL